MSDVANIIDVSDVTFEIDVIQRSHELPIVVDFWAPWCGPCRVLGPILERLAAEPAYDFILAKINVDDNPNVAMRYGVQGIPAVKAFVDGQIAAEFVGAQPEPSVRQFIEQLIPNDADIAFRAANSYLATHHWVEAEEAFSEMLDDFPDYVEAKLGLAKALLAQGSGCDARPYLDECRHSLLMLKAEKLLPLSHFLCRVETAVADDIDLDPIELQYRQAARLLQNGNLEATLDGLLDVLRQDKRFRKGEPKDVMISLFELLGEDNTLTQSYRRELAMVLY